MPDSPPNSQRGFSLRKLCWQSGTDDHDCDRVVGIPAGGAMNSLISETSINHWRPGWQLSQLYLISPVNWQVNQMQTTRAGCVSINVIIISPLGRQGQMTRLHCPTVSSQESLC
ncbi:prepilin-type N-terminal cleavage/methylation domain-containing protein [Shigella flexneri]